MNPLRKKYERTRDIVVDGYYRIENGVVSRYQTIENSFIDTFIAHEGESTEDAKQRITEQCDFIRERYA